MRRFCLRQTARLTARLLDGVGKRADLTLFEEGGQLPGIYSVDIILNGLRVESRDMAFHTVWDTDGKPYLKTCLTREMLTHYGVKTEEYPGLFRPATIWTGKPNHVKDAEEGLGEVCADLSLIPQATETYQFASQQLLLNIPQVALRPPVRGIAPEALWDDGLPAFLLNWQTNASRSEYRRYGKSASDNIWVSLKPGVNMGPWRLRNLTTWNKPSGQPGKWESSYIRLERGLNKIKSRLTLGEDYTPSDIFDSIPFRGVMLGADENMVPYNQREFAPVIRGVARTQARVEVRQNGYLIQSQTVSPGAFAITDLPVTGSGSDLQITVIESDGTIQRFSVPFTTPVIALREGYMKYNVTVGQYRPPDNAVENSLLGQLTTMYGLPWGITAFTGVQASQHYKSGAMGIGWSLGNLGAVSFDAIHARSQQKGRGRDSGDTWSIRYSKSFELTNTDLTAARYQYTSSGFHTLSDVLSTFRNDNFRAYSYSGDRSRRTTLRLNQSLGSLGYMSFYGSRDEFRHNRQKQDSFGMSYGTSWKNISWYVNCSRNYSTNAYYQRGHIEDSINLWMNIPLGQWIGGRDNDINVTTQTQRTTGQNTWYETGLNGRAFDRRLYWDVSERIAPGSENNVDSSRLNLRWFGTYGELAGMYSYSSYIRQMSAGISGGMVLHNEGITLGQKGEDTVALVVAPGVNGASVGSLPGVRTDTRGYTLVNHVSPYQENLITLDPTTFPENVEVSQTDTRVVPTKGAVVRAKFITRVGGRALITLSRSDGSRLPFGAVVTEEGKKGQMPGGAGVVGDNGEVYLSGLDETGQLKVQWGRNSSCRANYRLPEEKEATGIFLVRTVCM